MKRNVRNAEHLCRKTLALVLTFAFFFSLAVQDAGIKAFAEETGVLQDVPLSQMAATASSVWGGYNNDVPSDAIDGDSWTCWTSDDQTHQLPQWIKIDLGQTYNVAQIGIVSVYGGNITDHEIWVSDNDDDWMEVSSGSWDYGSGYDDWKQDDFEPASARYVRLVANAAVNQDGLPSSVAKICELRVSYEAEAGEPTDESVSVKLGSDYAEDGMSAWGGDGTAEQKTYGGVNGLETCPLWPGAQYIYANVGDDSDLDFCEPVVGDGR